MAEPDREPLEEVEYSRKATKESAGRNYVPPHLRPAEDAWEKAKAAVGELPVWEWMPDIIDVAGNNGPRLGEQLALRAIDVDLASEQLDVNGTWTVERKAETRGARRRCWRKPTTCKLPRERRGLSALELAWMRSPAASTSRRGTNPREVLRRRRW